MLEMLLSSVLLYILLNVVWNFLQVFAFQNVQ